MANQNYHHENLKSELIRNGLLILDKEGYENFSLRKVAKSCNVSQTAPYRHFKNKDELIAAIMEEAMRSFYDSLNEAALKYPDDPSKQLKEMGIAYIHFFSENPEYLHLLFSSNIFSKIKLTCDKSESSDSCSNGHYKNRDPFAVFYRAVENYAASANNCMERDELLLYCWGLVHGISVLSANKENSPFNANFLDLAEKIIFNEKFLK